MHLPKEVEEGDIHVVVPSTVDPVTGEVVAAGDVGSLWEQLLFIFCKVSKIPILDVTVTGLKMSLDRSAACTM